MTKVKYEIVRHEDGYAYRVGDVYSETYPSRDAAHAAAADAAERQKTQGETVDILYEDAGGDWHEEKADGDDRPETEIVDKAQ